MSPDDVDEAFREKDHQRQTIRCGIREVLNGSNVVLQNDIKTFLNNVVTSFDNTPSLADGGQKQLFSSGDNAMMGNKENMSNY